VLKDGGSHAAEVAVPVPPSRIKPVPSILDLALSIGTALLMCFAATLVLVHAGIYFAQPLIVS